MNELGLIRRGMFTDTTRVRIERRIDNTALLTGSPVHLHRRANRVHVGAGKGDTPGHDRHHTVEDRVLVAHVDDSSSAPKAKCTKGVGRLRPVGGKLIGVQRPG